MSTIEDLAGLQELELELDRIRARLLEIQALYAEPETLLQERAHVEDLSAQLAELRRRLRDLEDENANVRTKRDAGQKRLYGGTVTNPRELSGLEAEAEALGRRLAQLEDQQLTLMLEIDATSQSYAEAATKAKALEEDHALLTARLREEQAALEAERRSLEPQIAARRARVDKAALARYDALKARKGGRAIAPLRQGSCGACGVAVPTNIVQKAELRQELVPCPSCGRYLMPD